MLTFLEFILTVLAPVLQHFQPTLVGHLCAPDRGHCLLEGDTMIYLLQSD